MALFEIKNRHDGSLIFTLECDSLKLCLEAAVKSGAYLSRADLSGAYLSRANLSRANLSGADLSRAYLSRADLSGAYLSRADLSGACLPGANLSGADLSGAYLPGVKYGDGIPLENTPIMLQGTKYPILIMDTHIKIGCELHSHAEWESFSGDRIAKMDCGSLDWWNEWKEIVLNLSLGHQQRIAKGK